MDATFLAGALSPGPALDLLPHGCSFDEAAEMSFEINTAVGDYEGEAIFCGEWAHHTFLAKFFEFADTRHHKAAHTRRHAWPRGFVFELVAATVSPMY